MEERKIGTLIEITYQATKSTSGLTDVIMEIYDETRAKDAIDFPDVTMIEIGSTGRYYGSFTSDVEGIWRAMIDSASKSGKMVRDFKIVGHDVDSIGDAVAVVDGKAGVIKDKTDNLPASPASEGSVTSVGGAVTIVGGKADEIKAKTDNLPGNPAAAGEAAAAETNIRGGSDTLETLSDQLDGIATPDSPPMIG